MKKVTILFLIFIGISLSLAAQKETPKEDPRNETTDVILRAYDTNAYSNFICNTGSGKPMEMRKDWKEMVREVEQKIAVEEPSILLEPITIGLVFHMLNTNDTELAEQLIASQIEILNQDFNNRSIVEKHANDPDGVYLKRAGSVAIDFALADIAVVRKSEHPWSSWDEMKDPIKGGSAGINASHNINIWVCDLSEINSYATSPYLITAEDGIVIDARFFGISSQAEHAYTGGRTLTHLIGNYLGLSPLWGNGGRCSDDNVQDTPVHNASNYGCPQYMHVSYCDDHPVEMTMNFMDNTDDGCQVMFTEGQASRIRAMIKVVRPDFLNSKIK